MFLYYLYPCRDPIKKGGGDGYSWRLFHCLLLLHVAHIIQLLKPTYIMGKGYYLFIYVLSLEVGDVQFLF